MIDLAAGITPAGEGQVLSHPALRTAAGERHQAAEVVGEKLRALRALPPALRAWAA